MSRSLKPSRWPGTKISRTPRNSGSDRVEDDCLRSILDYDFGAEEGTRAPTALRVRGPEPGEAANSATSARYLKVQRTSAEPAASLSLANAACCVKWKRPAELNHSRPVSPRRLDALCEHFNGLLQPHLPRLFPLGPGDPAAVF